MHAQNMPVHVCRAVYAATERDGSSGDELMCSHNGCFFPPPTGRLITANVPANYPLANDNSLPVVWVPSWVPAGSFGMTGGDQWGKARHIYSTHWQF